MSGKERSTRVRLARRKVKEFFESTDAILRGSATVETGFRSLPGLAVRVAVFGAMYGAVMGSYGVLGAGFLQIGYSAIKTPLLLLASFGLALPTFYVLNAVVGLADDFEEALEVLLTAQAGFAFALACFAPLTAFWYVSVDRYSSAILANGAVFALATLVAHRLIRRGYANLIAKNEGHRSVLRAWSVLYSFVTIQMAWVLRPFVGSPNEPTRFLREDAWDNAYVVVSGIAWREMLRLWGSD